VFGGRGKNAAGFSDGVNRESKRALTGKTRLSKKAEPTGSTSDGK